MHVLFRPMATGIATMTAVAVLASVAVIAHGATSHADPGVRAKPTVVLVHGAWAGTSSWDGEASALRADGYPVRAIANPLRNLTTDAAEVASFVRTVDGPVVLVGHSYGGAVITEAAAGLTNVKALVYVDAAAPEVGETNGSLSGADSVLKHLPDSALFDTVRPPTAEPTSICARTCSSTTSPTTCLQSRPPSSGRRSVPRPPRRSTPRPPRRPGTTSRRGTSSAAATRSSPRCRSARWPTAPDPTSPSSPVDPT